MGFFDSKRILFDTWDSWLSYTQNAVTWLLKAVFGVLYAIVMGLVSALRKLGLFLMRLIRKWPFTAFLIVTTILTWCMVLMFAKLSYVAKTYEHERDSLSYELMVLKETIGIDKDTVTVKCDSIVIYELNE